MTHATKAVYKFIMQDFLRMRQDIHGLYEQPDSNVTLSVLHPRSRCLPRWISAFRSRPSSPSLPTSSSRRVLAFRLPHSTLGMSLVLACF